MSAVSNASMATQIWTWALLLRVLKQFVPLERLVAMVQRKQAAGASTAVTTAQVERYLRRKARFPFRPPANCLERSLSAYRILCRGGAAPQLVIGFRTASAGMEGHVWLTVNGRAMAESVTDLDGYTPALIFDSEGRRRTVSTFTDPLPAMQFK
jgi:hypothetical protein